MLASCYRASLKLAVEHQLKTIAFPAISCGIYGYPVEQAARIAVRTVREFLQDTEGIERVILTCFSQEVLAALCNSHRSDERPETVIQAICTAFGRNDYPGDHFLQGSFEGSEPYEAIEPFKGLTDWQAIRPELLDACYTALSFFSEAGLRFFLPAYLVADVQDALPTADPLFVLVHGFSEVSVRHQTQAGPFIRRSTGRTVFWDPRRYGAADLLRLRPLALVDFQPGRGQAIVTYLHYKRDTDAYHLHTEAIAAALTSYWLERAAHAPTAAELQRHLNEEAAYLAAISAKTDDYA
ncbi:MAG: macro domain-containing protein [Anaerolineae bacterium]